MASWWGLIAAQLGITGDAGTGSGGWPRKVAEHLNLTDQPGRSWAAKIFNGSPSLQFGEQGSWDKRMVNPNGAPVSVGLGASARYLYENQELSDPLVSRWTFDVADIDLPTVFDRKGGANGTLIGSVSIVAPGLVGDHALSVNNITTGAPATKYMIVPAASLAARPTSFSITWWTKNLTAPSLQETLVGVGKVDTSDISFLLRWSIVNHWQLYIPTGPVARYASHTPNGSGTHFFAATYDENASLNWRFYFDGVEQTAAGVSNMGPGQPMNWGADTDLYFLAAPNGALAGVSDGCNCIGDDLRVYNRVLTQAEITARFNNPGPNAP